MEHLEAWKQFVCPVHSVQLCLRYKIMEQGNINKQGRIFQFGKALGEDFRSLVIQSLIENGADSETRIIPRGVMSKISANFKVSKNP